MAVLIDWCFAHAQLFTFVAYARVTFIAYYFHRSSEGSLRSLGAQALGFLIALAVAVGGCGDGEPPLAEQRLGEEAVAKATTEVTLSELSTAELRRLADGSSAEGSHRWILSGEAARRLSLRLPDDEAAGYLERAKEIFERAAAQDVSACAAALELARLHAVDQRSLAQGYSWAGRAVQAERPSGEDQACVREARRIMAILAPFREASGDEDPPRPTREEELRYWASQQGERAPVELTALTVYGRADPNGPEAEHQSGQTVRAVLELSGITVFEPGELEARRDSPRRVFVDLPNTSLAADVPRQLSVQSGGVAQVRVATHSETSARVVFELAAQVEYSVFFLPNPFRVVFDFEAPENTAPRALDVIVIDPGHGGNDYGARANGLNESVLTLDLAQRVATKLETELSRTRIVLTRRNDTPVSLEERVAFANSVGADLFVSIHLNGWDEQLETGGVTTFVLDDTDDRQAIRLAARENNSSSRDVSGMQRILAGLHREEQVGLSRELAALVQASTVAGGRRILPRLPDRGVKAAMFYVLVGARMPAVLVEASFLTQEDEGRALRTDAYRDALSSGIADGIVAFVRRAPEP